MESNKAVAVPTGDTLSLTPQEEELKRLHQSVNRDVLAIGTLLIEMRSKQSRGEWTAYLESVAVRTDISRRSLFRYIASIEKPEKASKVPPLDFRKAKSPDGHSMGTLQSWLQKAVRRGDEVEAMYAAREFYITGFAGAVWNILYTGASEDIGLGERNLVQELLALHASYKIEASRHSEHFPERLQLTHATLLCCRSRKSRLVDHALICAFEGGEKRTPPGWVFDVHTQEGRRAGKTVEDFFDDENPALSPRSDVPDPYQEKAKAIRVKNRKPEGKKQ